MLRLLSFVALLFAAFTATAADDDHAAIRAAIQKNIQNAKIQSIDPSPMPGFFSVVLDGHVLYISGDGRYLIEGRAFDLESHQDLSGVALASVRKAGLAQIGDDKKIIFAPKNPKHTIVVFTDVDCPYCRQFHKQIAEYNRMGIAVEYVLFPLSIHPGADKKAQTVWCEKDRNTAYTNAMNGAVLPQKSCSNPIAEIGSLATTMGISGTPAIFTKDGVQVGGGYLGPEALEQQLDDMDKTSKPVTAK